MARVRRSRKEWVAFVRAFEESGLSARLFAAKHDLHESTLRWWRTQLRPDRPAGKVAFVDVVVAEAAPVRHVDRFVVLVGGVGHRVLVPLGFDAGELRRLVDALC